MTGSQPDWENQRALLAVLREGSLLAASRVLGVTQPTVRRRIDALEAALGMPLFARSATALVPTEMARELRRPLEAMERAALALERLASADRDAVDGTVRLATSELIGVEILPALLPPFLRHKPDLRIEWSLSNRLENLVGQQADIAVRTARPRQEAVVARRVGRSEVGLYANPELIRTHGLPLSPEQLPDLPLVGPDRNPADWTRLRDCGLALPPGAFTVRTDNHLAQLAAIRAGLGAGLCHQLLAQREGWVRVLPDACRFELDFWVAMPENLRQVRRVHALFAFLGDALERELANVREDPSR